ncbi:energy-coupling factor ABC transporter ATP-binding protein [Sporohalobacter salinus]|uniref:energy-coupling factor ABC transporter ATP-binding protein n=1 Tax=Sporohalobacter salinus TaxID=1494606 RepID=UPI001EF78F2C|nr:energy-coupling factor ABC transporter ATP-binding protein [Sporohalobacter salinus]MBM7624427.1 cobalt/nickel transport system ATP-binding protein [Sporohalobacter salinus]
MSNLEANRKEENKIIELKDISFQYLDGTTVLDNFNFNLKKGDRLGLIGPNGAGKTTVFKIIMGLLVPQSGKVVIFDKERTQKDDFLEVRERIGFLFQDPDDQLFCPTVEEEIAFGPLNLGKSEEEAMQIVDDTLELVGMEGFRKKVTYNLSGGEKRIISFASILSMQPEVLLLDEPFAGLDQEMSGKVIEILNNIPQSYVIVSHNEEFLDQVIADYCYV